MYILYRCPTCVNVWAEKWGCACDSECEYCGTGNIQAYTWSEVEEDIDDMLEFVAGMEDFLFKEEARVKIDAGIEYFIKNNIELKKLSKRYSFSSLGSMFVQLGECRSV